MMNYELWIMNYADETTQRQCTDAGVLDQPGPRPRRPPLGYVTFTFITFITLLLLVTSSITLLILPAHCMPAQP